VLAYVFWHAPAPRTAVADYERALAAFHGVLAGAPPAGFHDSTAARLDGPPWPGGAAAYEDWYLVEDWAALGTLNEAAVAGARRAPHDAAAAMARDGVAGVYAPVRGAVAPPREAHAAWLAKPPGMGYDAFLAALGDGHAAVWQRQMTLGPAPEFCVLDGAPLALPWPAAVLARRVVV
jgi:hypothetical protein